MPKVIGNPICFQGHTACFAYKNGSCTILTETDFRKDKVCPFFKNRDLVEKERERSYQRLMDIGAYVLIEKYMKNRGTDG